MIIVLALIAAQCPTPEDALTGLVIPADGAGDVPTNATPFVDGNNGALELKLVGLDGSEIASDIEQIAVGNGFGATGALKRIIPSGALVPGQTVTVVADGSALTHFTVGAASDQSGPGAPTADVGDCGGGVNSAITIGVASDDAVLFVGVVDGQPTLGAGARVDGASSNGQLVLFGTGTAKVNVAGVDLAGNVGASTPVDVTFPPAAALCSCASPKSGAPRAGLVAALAAAALVGHRRRGRA